jgi:hypothetical protein
MLQSQPKQFGALLTVWLILVILANVATALIYILLGYGLAIGNALVVEFFGSIPLWATVVFSVFSVVNVCAAVALFKWRKWGFYAFCISAAVALTVNLVLGLGVLAFGGLASLVILYLLLRSKWSLLH